MPLGRVQRDPGARSDPFDNRLQPLDPAGKFAARIECLELVRRFRKRPGRVEKRQIVVAARRSESTRIFGVQFTPHRLARRGIERECAVGQHIHQIGQREIDRYVGEARRFETCDRQQHGLARSGHCIAADEFRAHLEALAGGIELIGAEQSHFARIAEPERPRCSGETRCRYAPDLHGHVAAQGQRAQAVGIGEAHHPPGRDTLHAPGERMLELDQRGAHPVVAVRIHRIEHGAHRPRDRSRSLGQRIFEADGEKIVLVGHAPPLIGAGGERKAKFSPSADSGVRKPAA